MPILPRGKRLKKDLTLFDVYAISTGAMFSSGFFLLPGLAAAKAGPGVILAYLIAGLLILPAMFSKAELSTAMPRAGGTYYFLDRSFGPLVGTVGGLGTYLALTLKSAFALVGMGAYLAFFVDIPIKPLAIVLTIAFMVINIVGAKETTALQRLLVIVLLAVLAFFIVQGLFEVADIGVQRIVRTQLTPFLPFGVEGLLATVGFVFVSYAGLTKVASVAEEVRDPDRNIPLGMGLSLVTVSFIYVVGVLVMVAVLDPEALHHDLTPVATASAAFFDWLPEPIGLLLIVAAAVAAFASTGNAGLMSASRYPLAMARDRLIPDTFAQLGRFQTPMAAILVTTALMIVCIIVLNEEGIAKLASAFQLFIFMLVNFAVIVMRESRIGSYDPGFRSPLYPWMQILGIVAPIVLIGFMGWLAILSTLGMTAVCMAWYFYYAQHRVERHGAIYHWFERLGRRRYEGLDAELRTILKEKGLRDEDPFDEIVARAGVVDTAQAVTFDEIVARAADHIGMRLRLAPAEIAQEFMEGTRIGATPVARGVALPHILVAGLDQPELVVVRVRSGIAIPAADEVGAGDERTAYALFFLASPKDNPGQHLRMLAQIASRADDARFLHDWLAAEDGQQLKEVLLRAERFLALTIGEQAHTASLAGRALRDIDWPEGCLVALIRRRGRMIVPGGNTALEKGDRVTIIGNPEGIEALRVKYLPIAAPVAYTPLHLPADASPASTGGQKSADDANGGTARQDGAGEAVVAEYKNLLVGLDLRDHDEAVIRYAGLISHLTQAERVQFVHVFRMVSASYGDYSYRQYNVHFQTAAAHLREEVESLVNQFFSGPRATTVGCDVIDDVPLEGLLRLARETKVDLLMMRPDRHGNTLAEKLARKAPCSVLIVPPDTRLRIERILVPVDFSAHAGQALGVAAVIAEAAGLSELHILHVYAGSPSASDEPRPLGEPLRRQAEDRCRTFLETVDLRGLTAQLYFTPGENVPHLIGAHAEAMEADLVVLGTRGQTAGAAVLMGSVTEGMVRWARRPVLTVKQKGETLSLLKALFE